MIKSVIVGVTFLHGKIIAPYEGNIVVGRRAVATLALAGNKEEEGHTEKLCGDAGSFFC